MSTTELIERLTALVKLQADIIEEQAMALAQHEAFASAEDKIAEAERERMEIIGE